MVEFCTGVSKVFVVSIDFDFVSKDVAEVLELFCNSKQFLVGDGVVELSGVQLAAEEYNWLVVL